MKRLAAAVLAVCLTLAAVGYVLLATQVGLNWLIRGAERGVDQVKIRQATGSVLGGFSLQDVSYQDAGLSAAVREIEIEWQPKALLRGTFISTRFVCEMYASCRPPIRHQNRKLPGCPIYVCRSMSKSTI